MKKFLIIFISFVLAIIGLLNHNTTNISSDILDPNYIKNNNLDDVDIVLYPFSVDISKTIINPYNLFKDDQTHSSNIDLGYSSIINLTPLSTLKKHLNLSSSLDIYSTLGQYCFYRNFNNIEYLVFYDWYSVSDTLNIVVIENNNIEIISQTIKDKEWFPIAITPLNESIIILLYQNNNYKISILDSEKNTIDFYDFSTNNESLVKSYFVDSSVINDKLYIAFYDYMVNNDILTIDYLNSYCLIFDINNYSISKIDLPYEKIDFFLSYSDSLYFGCLDNNSIINISVLNTKNSNYTEIELNPSKSAIRYKENSAFILNDIIHLHFYNNNSEYNGLYQAFSLKDGKILSSRQYKFSGGCTYKYYIPNTSLDFLNSSSK